MTLRQARDKALEVRGAVVKGGDPVREATAKATALTLRQLFARLKHAAHKARSALGST
jgi:hypothetical protein